MSRSRDLAGYGWRKYDSAVPLLRWNGRGVCDPSARFFYPSFDRKVYPDLPGWEFMDSAFIGYVGYGSELPHATAYWVPEVLNALKGVVYSTFSNFVDDDNRKNVVLGLLGVWFGEKTPYFMTEDKTLFSGRELKKVNL